MDTTTPEGLLRWIRTTMNEKYSWNATARFAPCYQFNGWIEDADGNRICEKPHTHFIENSRHRIKISAEAYNALHAAWTKDRHGHLCANSARGLKAIREIILALPGYREIDQRLAKEEAVRELRREISNGITGLEDAIDRLVRLDTLYGQHLDQAALASAMTTLAAVKDAAASKLQEVFHE
ncbi:MAG: hypothetical protein GX616_10055 [Planctomycetes bacterium]|nr:hypothetical protein [Planctomycetota bacterium]